MHRQIGAKPCGVVPAFKMAGGFLAMQAAKSCRITVDLPVDRGHGFNDDGVVA